MRKILFVCIENSFRSQIAEGFARALSGEFVEAYSAGSKPSGTVAPAAIQLMNELGIDISGHTSKGLDALPSVEFDAVVTMGCGDACPTVKAKQRIDWPLDNPKGQPIEVQRKMRDDIEQRVKQLLETV
ncbi:MAG: arsenate reductase ArsC [Nitrospirota bacterium]|nr:arsenate reductase ArsC [Nitrospirota bacterium]